MVSREVKIRVAYYDTDAMGVVHHSNYARYYEVARTEMLRHFGTSYREMEENGIMLPVLEVFTKCVGSAFYDELLTVKVTMAELPKVKLRFDHEVYRPDGTLINTGYVLLAFIDSETRRPCRAPQYFIDLFKEQFQ